jgi:hypothetical protein
MDAPPNAPAFADDQKIKKPGNYAMSAAPSIPSPSPNNAFPSPSTPFGTNPAMLAALNSLGLGPLLNPALFPASASASASVANPSAPPTPNAIERSSASTSTPPRREPSQLFVPSPRMKLTNSVNITQFCAHYNLPSITVERLEALEYTPGQRGIETLEKQEWLEAGFKSLGWQAVLTAHKQFLSDVQDGSSPWN